MGAQRRPLVPLSEGPFTDILDVMRDTGFNGVRLTGYPDILKTYNLNYAQNCPRMRIVHVI